MAGLGLADGKARQALDAVKEKLATPHGIVVLNPAFTQYQLRLGEISSYPPVTRKMAAYFAIPIPGS
jgi:cellobiose phosphorylase